MARFPFTLANMMGYQVRTIQLSLHHHSRTFKPGQLQKTSNRFGTSSHAGHSGLERKNSNCSSPTSSATCTTRSTEMIQDYSPQPPHALPYSTPTATRSRAAHAAAETFPGRTSSTCRTQGILRHLAGAQPAPIPACSGSCAPQHGPARVPLPRGSKRRAMPHRPDCGPTSGTLGCGLPAPPLAPQLDRRRLAQHPGDRTPQPGPGPHPLRDLLTAETNLHGCPVGLFDGNFLLPEYQLLPLGPEHPPLPVQVNILVIFNYTPTGSRSKQAVSCLKP